MNYSINKQEKYAILEVKEEKLDALLAPELKAIFVDLDTDGIRNLILNLKHVKYVDSSGLSAILIANRLCKESEGSLVLVEVNNHTMKLIQISQLDKVLNITPTEEEGIDLVMMNEIENDLKKSKE